LHILYIIDSLILAGAERSLAALTPALVAKEISVDVAYLHERPGVQSELRSAGANLFCLEGNSGRVGWILRSRRLIAERRPDLVHTTLFEADVAGRIAARSLRVPVVSSLVGLSYGVEHFRDPSLNPLKIRAAQLLDVATARSVVRFHAISTHLADAMARNLRVPRGRIDVIPRGREPERLGTRGPERSARVLAALGLSDPGPIVVAVSRHVYKKGLDVLIEAFATVKQQEPLAHLLVAGYEGAQTSAISAAVRRKGLGGSVRLLGPRDDVADLLSAADVFVFPSRSEGFGGALIEAMALQAPIVASDIPPVREVVGDDGSAMLVQPERPGSLAAAITETIADPLGAAERARRARQRFLSHFTIDRVAQRMVEFYERALHEAGRKQAPASRHPRPVDG
jgi:glycosyltransferase involved in cell wall biosynthesis